MKLPRRTIPASGSGRCRAAGLVARRVGAGLSDAAGAHHRRLPAWRRHDITRRLIGLNGCQERLGQPFIVENRPGAASNSQPKPSCAPLAMAIRFCWSDSANAINATLYDKLNFNFIRDIAPVASIMAVAARHRGQSRPFRPRPFLSSSPMPRPIRARSIWRRAGIGHTTHLCRRAVQDR